MLHCGSKQLLCSATAASVTHPSHRSLTCGSCCSPSTDDTTFLLCIPLGDHGTAFLRSLPSRRCTTTLLLLTAAAPITVAVAVALTTATTTTLLLLATAAARPLLLATAASAAKVLWVLVVHFPHNTTLNGLGDVLDVQEVAIGATVAARLMESTTSGFTEIGDSSVLSLDQFSAVETSCKLAKCTLRVFLVVVLDIHIPNQVVTQVIHDDDIFNLTIVGQLQEDLNVECFQVLLSSVVHVIIPRFIVCQCEGFWSVGVHVR
mmetsp:Transcript_28166/g.49137  ORF Transcript_28166/g.49137 Transcript_28166/m.49137 type:complete len:262 (+) Transcript_28166:21-806(+)